MRVKGVNYDAGLRMSFDWRPVFDPKVVRREFEIIRGDLHCTAVAVLGEDLPRLTAASGMALDAGLDVWFCPRLWDKDQQATLDYIEKAASAAEPLRERWGDKVILSIGAELSLFMRGIFEGKSLAARMGNPTLVPRAKAGEHNKPLNDFLTKAVNAARQSFKGGLAYSSLVWEKVDWAEFSYVGVDHYRIASIEDRYLDMLKPAFAHGKPVVVTEFGYGTCEGGIGSEGFLSTAGLGGNIIDLNSQYLHNKLPVLGRFIRPHLRGVHSRDEAWQAKKLREQLALLEGAGVEGTFVSQFISQVTPYSDNPRFDLDMASTSLVKYFEGGRRGTTYPDMPWEPKESFKAVADYYANH